MRFTRRALVALIAALAMLCPMAGIASAAPTDNSACTVWVHGIDVSNNNRVTDWSAVPSSGVAFAYLKATEGTTFVDHTLFLNTLGATSAGIPVGVYDFARPGSNSPEAEAQFFLAHGGDAKLTLPPALDLETTGGLNSAQLADWTNRWRVTVLQATGRVPVLYMGAFFMGASAADTAKFTPLWIPAYPAGYASDPNPCLLRQPTLPAGFSGWSIWQYTSSAHVNGIVGSVDSNVAAPAWFAQATGIGSAPAPVLAPIGDAAWQVYQLGSQGPGVAKVQQIVGVTPDGVYGQATKDAVARWQSKLGLKADGIWGTTTQQATDDLFKFLDDMAVANYLRALTEAKQAAYLTSLAASRTATAAYLASLNANTNPVAAYLASVAAQKAAVDAYLAAAHLHSLGG